MAKAMTTEPGVSEKLDCLDAILRAGETAAEMKLLMNNAKEAAKVAREEWELSVAHLQQLIAEANDPQQALPFGG